MIDLNPVVMLEELPTIATASVLLFQQFGQSQTGTWIPSSSRAPVHPIAVIRTPVARDLNMPCNRHLTMREKVHRISVRGGCGKDQTRVLSAPIPILRPGDGFC